jgi:hypothetical protein
LIPKTLRPLLEKRLMLKNILSDLDPRDCRVEILKARASALKWLLVVCFGYLGYKNARFGKIESHEAVTAMSRELMLQAKEVAEDMGFTVLHMYGRSFGRLVNASLDAICYQEQIFSPWRHGVPRRSMLVSSQGTRASCEG